MGVGPPRSGGHPCESSCSPPAAGLRRRPPRGHSTRSSHAREACCTDGHALRLPPPQARAQPGRRLPPLPLG
eukprot:5389312-Alexandrium_andersonii.AAC.1